MAEIVKQLTTNLKRIAALPKSQHPEPWFSDLAPKADETAAQYRVRALDVIGARWNRKGNTVRCMEGPRRLWKEGSRQFFADLQRYGACEFRKDGSLVKASLGKGMDMMTYMDSVSERQLPTPRDVKPARKSARA